MQAMVENKGLSNKSIVNLVRYRICHQEAWPINNPTAGSVCSLVDTNERETTLFRCEISLFQKHKCCLLQQCLISSLSGGKRIINLI